MDRSSYHTEGNPLVNYLSLSFLNQCGKSGVSTNELGLIAGEPLAALQGTAVPAACLPLWCLGSPGDSSLGELEGEGVGCLPGVYWFCHHQSPAEDRASEDGQKQERPSRSVSVLKGWRWNSCRGQRC